MPGVPSYRGCDACHKQKKKCDQGTPACARCARLKIPCIGKGQLRYKFKQQTVFVNDTPPLPKQSKALTPPSRTIWTPPHSPDNEISHLADSFISVLQITDPKYDLTCFGEWFVGVPARLGTSEVLDKAADAFVAGLGGLRTGKQTVDSMVKYGKALTSLRATLMQPGTASSPHTLCAIFMIMVCQGWYSRTDDGTFSHMEGIAHLLNASAGQDWEDGFDATMRFNMIYPAAVEAIINPKIKLHPWYLESYRPPLGPQLPLVEEHGQPIESLDLPAVMNFPKFVREPELHGEEMRRTYDRLRIEGPFCLKRVHLINGMVKEQDPPPPELLRAQVQLETAYALLLCYSLILNVFLSAFEPLNVELQQEAQYMANEAITISKQSATHLPIGAGFMPAGLFAAWVATDDADIIEEIRQTLSTYEIYSADVKYVRMFRGLKKRAREIRQRSLDALLMGQQGYGDFDHFLYEQTVQGMEFDTSDYDWGLHGQGQNGVGSSSGTNSNSDSNGGSGSGVLG